MSNRYDAVMARLPHGYLLAKAPGAGPPFVRAMELEPVTTDAVASFEKHLGHALPVDYREFLQQYGDVCFDRDTLYDGEPALSVMFGVRPNSAHPLFDEWPVPYEGMPHHCLPIALSVIDEIVAISLAHADYGMVYVRYNDAGYWDESKGEYEGVELLANSFDSLITGSTSRQ